MEIDFLVGELDFVVLGVNVSLNVQYHHLHHGNLVQNGIQMAKSLENTWLLLITNNSFYCTK